jgi:hypothetical protein
MGDKVGVDGLNSNSAVALEHVSFLWRKTY